LPWAGGRMKKVLGRGCPRDHYYNQQRGRDKMGKSGGITDSAGVSYHETQPGRETRGTRTKR